MVEGYMDAISLHSHGITNAVASLGTAFTVEQARLLKKYADEIVFSYDMDSAGQNATKRALEIAGSVGLKLRVAVIHDTTAKCNYVPSYIQDRKHATVPEIVKIRSIFYPAQACFNQDIPLYMLFRDCF